MKIKVTTPLKVPFENAGHLLNYSKEAVSLVPEIVNVQYEKGSESEFGVGTVLRVKQVVRKSEEISTVEILDFKKGEYVVQRITQPYLIMTNRTALSRTDSNTLLHSDSDLEFTSLPFKLISPVLAMALKRFYRKRYLRIARHFDPTEKNHRISIKITMAGLPLWLILSLSWIGVFFVSFVFFRYTQK